MVTTVFEEDIIFESSGTTETINSRHYVKSRGIYEQSFLTAFDHFYGNPDEWCVLGLLPSYLERQHSSLVYMVEELVKRSGHEKAVFTCTTLTGYMSCCRRWSNQDKNPADRSDVCIAGFCGTVPTSVTIYTCHGNRRYERTEKRNDPAGGT
ncbi:hypothetical protein LWM68_03510 [Niabella sp. W65]|nr:hypothetical protein [Niabella sp. W65]MCH7361929.1 hypothetical protein [Niabella sp. W65]